MTRPATRPGPAVAIAVYTGLIFALFCRYLTRLIPGPVRRRVRRLTAVLYMFAPATTTTEGNPKP